MAWYRDDDSFDSGWPRYYPTWERFNPMSAAHAALMYPARETEDYVAAINMTPTTVETDTRTAEQVEADLLAAFPDDAP